VTALLSRAPRLSLLTVLAVFSPALSPGCGDQVESTETGVPTPDSPLDLPRARTDPSDDPVEPVADCEALRERARSVPADLVVQAQLCPGLALDRAELKTLLLAEGTAPGVARWIPILDPHPELQGLARLAILDRSSQALPGELPDPGTALLTPVDDRILAAIELAHAQIAATGEATVDEATRTRAHAFLARLYLQALQTLGLQPGRPLPPFARSLAAQFLLHGRSFCRFYWQRRIGGLERTFAEVEMALLALSIDLENTPHAGDGALLAVERQRTRVYLQRSGPAGRIAARARSRADARGMSVDLLLPLTHELGRLVDHGFIDAAVQRSLRVGGARGGPGLDPVVALLTERLRDGNLREYERRTSRAIAAGRRHLPRGRQTGSAELAPDLPVEWPSAAEVSARAHAWLSVAHGRGPDFARRHAIARAVILLRDRPDALRDLATPPEVGPESDLDPVLLEHRALLLALLDALDRDSLTSLQIRVYLAAPGGRASLRDRHRASLRDRHRASLRDRQIRRQFALATREALMHPR